MLLRSSAKIAVLKSVPLFAHCSKSELKAIARITDEISFPAGRELIREGERGREFFVILDGTVDVRRGGRKLRTVEAGGFVGEVALLSKVPRTATVTAVTPIDVLVLEDRAFLRLAQDVPSIAVKVAQALAERVPES